MDHDLFGSICSNENISCISDTCTMIYNIAKLQLLKSNENNFMVWVIATGGTVLKGCSIRKVENHWCSSPNKFLGKGNRFVFISFILLPNHLVEAWVCLRV